MEISNSGNNANTANNVAPGVPKISDFTTAELIQMTGLSDAEVSNVSDVVSKTSALMARYPKVANFWQEVQNQLVQFARELGGDAGESSGTDSLASSSVPAKQQQDWMQNEALRQPGAANEVQNDKITERKQKIDVFGNQHVPMNRQKLGVSNNYQVPVAQDSLNPNLRNTTQRMVNLDSIFRDSGSDTSTDYSVSIGDTIMRAYSMRLYSFYVPYTWYVIDAESGNTCFWILNDGVYIGVSIDSGNYTAAQFVVEVTAAMAAAGFTFVGGQDALVYNANTGKLTFNIVGATFSGVDIYGAAASFTVVAGVTSLYFFDFNGLVQCASGCVARSRTLNSTLGWLMGYRLPFVSVAEVPGNTAAAVLDLNGTKYLMLSIDDYCQNHVNHSLVSIASLKQHIKLPSYYVPTLPYFCIPARISNLGGMLAELGADDDTEAAGMLLGSKFENDYTATQQLLPSAPRTLTTAQLYTINQINQLNNNNVSYLAKAPTSPDILAILPVKIKGLSVGDPIVEFSGSLQDNIRNYFGPVNIKRLGVRLLDDRGNVLNLNGGDWCVELIFDCLYQY